MDENYFVFWRLVLGFSMVTVTPYRDRAYFGLLDCKDYKQKKYEFNSYNTRIIRYGYIKHGIL